MAFVTGLKCIHCGQEYRVSQAEYFCETCGYNDGILDVVYDYEAVHKELNPVSLARNGDYSMWRYLALLPIDEPALIPNLAVGWTPLYGAPKLAKELGVAKCWIKD